MDAKMRTSRGACCSVPALPRLRERFAFAPLGMTIGRRAPLGAIKISHRRLRRRAAACDAGVWTRSEGQDAESDEPASSIFAWTRKCERPEEHAAACRRSLDFANASRSLRSG